MSLSVPRRKEVPGPDATYNGNTVVIDVSNLMELLFNLGVLALRPDGESHINILHVGWTPEGKGDKKKTTGLDGSSAVGGVTYCTP